MNPTISMSRFRSETESCKHFLLTYDDPLSPLSFSIPFDHIAVCLSASPYISLRNGNTKLCLSHVESIKKYGSSESEKGFVLVCNDYSLSDIPSPVRFSLKCY